jgi:hypothetical protein
LAGSVSKYVIYFITRRPGTPTLRAGALVDRALNVVEME